MCLHIIPDKTCLEVVDFDTGIYRVYKYVLYRDKGFYSPCVEYQWVEGQHTINESLETHNDFGEIRIGRGAFHFFTSADTARRAARENFYRNAYLLEATVSLRDIIAIGPDDWGRTSVAVSSCMVKNLPTENI